MRAVREHPRVAAAKTLIAVLLVAMGVGIGTVLGGGDHDNRADVRELRMASAQRALTARSAELRTARSDARRAEVTADRARAEVEAARRTNRRLERELASERRALRRAKRRR
jgi:chromosome segregation ATPase